MLQGKLKNGFFYLLKRIIMNKMLLCIAGLSLLTACGGSNTEKEDLHFYVAGHTCGGDKDSINGMYEPFVTYLEQHKKDTFDFAVLTGDIVHNGNSDDWNAVESVIKKQAYPFHLVPGYQELQDSKEYRNRFGSGNKHFEKGNNLFVTWEVVENGWNITDELLKEFQTLTAKKTYDNIFIFVPEVIWWHIEKTPQIVPNSIDGRNEVNDFYTKTLPILASRTTPVYLFSGDVGARAVGSELTMHKYKNVHMIASGMGGGMWDNFISVSTKNGKAQLQVNYLNGRKSLKLHNGYVNVFP